MSVGSVLQGLQGILHPSQLFLRLSRFLVDCVDPGLPLYGFDTTPLFVQFFVHLG